MGYQELFSLNNRGIVVAGGAGHLGAKIVEGLLDFGAKVVVADNSPKTKSEIVPNTEHHDRLWLVPCDLLVTASIQQMFQEAEKILGTIDVLFNCAAYMGYAGTGDADSMSDETWRQGIEGTVGLTFRTTREAVPYLKKSKQASVINFGSLYALIGPDFRVYEGIASNSPPNYGAGKAAIVQLTRHSASQFAKYGIRVNAIIPGSYPNSKTQENTEFVKRLADRTMLGRIGYPEDLVGVSVFLASDASQYVTGAKIAVDGGQTAW